MSRVRAIPTPCPIGVGGRWGAPPVPYPSTGSEQAPRQPPGIATTQGTSTLRRRPHHRCARQLLACHYRPTRTSTFFQYYSSTGIDLARSLPRHRFESRDVGEMRTSNRRPPGGSRSETWDEGLGDISVFACFRFLQTGAIPGSRSLRPAPVSELFDEHGHRRQDRNAWHTRRVTQREAQRAVIGRYGAVSIARWVVRERAHRGGYVRDLRDLREHEVRA